MAVAEVVDRSAPLPTGHLHQPDGTHWMALYCQKMLFSAVFRNPPHTAAL
jgi:hypothetical protein